MITKEQIREIVEGVFQVDISSKCRQRRYVNARFAYCHFCREYTLESLANVGNLIDRDHATVLHALKQYHIAKRYDGYLNYHNLVQARIRLITAKYSPNYSAIKQNDEKWRAHLTRQNEILKKQLHYLRKRLYYDTGRISKTV